MLEKFFISGRVGQFKALAYDLLCKLHPHVVYIGFYRYKECEDGLYRLQIFRYESIEISKQISLDDIGVSIDVDQCPESVPSTSTVIQSNETTVNSTVLPK